MEARQPGRRRRRQGQDRQPALAFVEHAGGVFRRRRRENRSRQTRHDDRREVRRWEEGRSGDVWQKRRRRLRIAAGRAGRRESRFGGLHGSEQDARRDFQVTPRRGGPRSAPRRAGLKACATAVLALAVGACHATPRPNPLPAPPARPARPAAPGPPAHPALIRDIDAVLAVPALERGYWGVLVKSLKTGETFYARNAQKLMMPASNMKIVTLAAAAERLGWDYTYETRILGAGAIDGGVLDGDLLVVGSGDPSLVVADGVSARVFDDWAERLKALGVRTIRGRVIGDDNTFDDEELGFGWSWDDLPDDYAAGVSALQFNENAARVTVSPGAHAGEPASVDLAPAGTGLVVNNLVNTGAADTPASIAVRRLAGSSRLELRGSI